jgi:hypothetical protein
MLGIRFSLAHRLTLTQFIAEDQTNEQPIAGIGGWFFHHYQPGPSALFMPIALDEVSRQFAAGSQIGGAQARKGTVAMSHTTGPIA